MGASSSDADKILKRYLSDHFVKKEMRATWDSFQAEVNRDYNDVFWVDKRNGGILQEWISSCYQSKIDSCLSLSPPPPLPSLPTLPSFPNFDAFVHPDNAGGFQRRTSVLSCHFSSDGHLLACAGQENKVVLYNVDDGALTSSVEEHLDYINDIKFKSETNVLATASKDRTIKIWDASNISTFFLCLEGHKFMVESLDFHPTMDILCSTLPRDVTALWSLNEGVMFKTLEGANKVRFQPRSGILLAAAVERTVSIYDTRTWHLVYKTSDVHHPRKINSICWDHSGNFLASVCLPTACVWSVAQGGALMLLDRLDVGGDIRENFYSCTFHPRFHVLIIGGLLKTTIWEISTGAARVVDDDDASQSVDLSSSTNRNLIASCKRSGQVVLFRVSPPA